MNNITRLFDFPYHQLEKYNLSEHPLLSQGYASVGCTHCTMKGDNRSGRWTGNEKVECGLHLPVETEKFIKV